MFRTSIIARSIKVLSNGDQKKVIAVLVIQILFGLLDLAGVALVGVLGALAVTGVQAKMPGDRVAAVLEFLNLDGYKLQQQAMVIGLIAATILILKTLFSIIFVRKTVFFLSRRSAKISSELVERVFSQPLVSVQSRSMQDTLYAVTAGVDAITLGVLNTTVLVISDLSLLAILALGLYAVDPVVAVSSMLTFGAIAFLLYRLLQVRAVRLGYEQRNLSVESSEKILEVLNSYREIIVRNRRQYYASELGKLRFRLADVNAERAFMPNISKYAIETTVVLGTLAIAALQFYLNDASRAIAVLSVFMAASTRISPAILRLQQGAVLIKSSIGSAGPTLDLIEELRDAKLSNEGIDQLKFNHADFSGEISLKSVSMTYQSKNVPAVKEITLRIKPGQVVAFVGPSGAGKTTVIDLILGVLEADIGEVQIENMPPLDAIRKWPGSIGYVPQDVMISNGTIRQNVCLGYSTDQFDDDPVWAALETAQLADFVKGLPNGLDTQVGDRGAQLSGGQRQRLGIARAMFTKPRLLVLDEATSALDGTTEASISEAVHQLKGGVTIVLIAHRLSTVRESDVIHYMEDGKILKSGTFEEIKMVIPKFAEQARLMGL
jgi:ABC-type multidrug transport system fused ATPase/permease subunit